MSLAEAIEAGLIVRLTVDKRTILTDSTHTYVVWHDPGRALPWRWARREWRDDGGLGQQHGGSGTLEGCLWAIVYDGGSP